MKHTMTGDYYVTNSHISAPQWSVSTMSTSGTTWTIANNSTNTISTTWSYGSTKYDKIRQGALILIDFSSLVKYPGSSSSSCVALVLADSNPSSPYIHVLLNGQTHWLDRSFDVEIEVISL